MPDGSEYWGTFDVMPNSFTRGLDSGALGPYSPPMGGVYFTPSLLNTQSLANLYAGNVGYQLEARLPQSQVIAPLNSASAYTVECWFSMDPGVVGKIGNNYAPFVPLTLADSTTQRSVSVGIEYGTTKNGISYPNGLYVAAEFLKQPPLFGSENWGTAPQFSVTTPPAAPIGQDVVQIPHHLVAVIQGNDGAAATVTFYLDGQPFPHFNPVTMPAVGQTYDTIIAGGAYGGAGNFWGKVQMVSVYQYALSPQQITQHCQFGQYGNWEMTSDDAIAQLASFAQIPPFWNSVQALHQGLTITDYLPIVDNTALVGMQSIEQAEQGLLYVNNLGQLTFHTRDWRMGYGAPDLLLPPDSFDAAMQYQDIDTFLQNEFSVENELTMTSSFVNQASQQQHGIYSTNGLQSPLQVPLFGFSRGYIAAGLPALSFWPDPCLDDTAQWKANSRSDSWLTPGQLSVDLQTIGKSTTGLNVASFYALDIDNMIGLSGTLPASLPNQPHAVEWFVEGIKETYSLSQRTM